MLGWEWHMLEEERAMRALRKVMDRTSKRLGSSDLDEDEAVRVMELTRSWVLKVFPDKVQAYDSIYKPKFEHIYYNGRKTA